MKRVMTMSNEEAYTPDDTPACPFCSTEKTLQVKQEEARCFNQDCRCQRFNLDDSDDTQEKIEIPKPDFIYEPYVKVTDGYHTYEIIAPMYNTREGIWSYYVIDHTGDEMNSDLIWLHVLNDDFEEVEESEETGGSR